MDFETIAVDGKVVCTTHGNNAKEKLHILTADAMVCQKETVAKIIEKEGDYCIGLKGN